jgi:hypothetical protein
MCSDYWFQGVATLLARVHVIWARMRRILVYFKKVAEWVKWGRAHWLITLQALWGRALGSHISNLFIQGNYMGLDNRSST